MPKALSNFINNMLHAPFPRALRVSFAAHAFLILFAGFDIFNLFPPRPIQLPSDVQVMTEKEFQQLSREIKKQAVEQAKLAKLAEKKKPAETPKPIKSPKIIKKPKEKPKAVLKPAPKPPVKEKTASKVKVTQNQSKLSTDDNKKAVKKEKIDLSNLVIQSSDDTVFDDSQLLLIEEDTEKIQQQLQEDTELLEKLSQQQDIIVSNNLEDLDSELTSAELTILREQLFVCWNPPIGAKNYESLVIRARVDLDEEGNLQNVKILHRLGANQSDPFYIAAVESVMRAIYHPNCTPLQLPANKYDIWKRTILTFNPTDILQ